MQAAGERIGAARALLEFTARMQTSENDFHRRHFFFRVQADRNAAAIILDADAAILVQRDDNVLAKAAERLIRCVIDDFLDDVERVLGPGVHARALLDGFESFEDAYR